MELQSIRCKQCGAAMPYTVGDVHLKCDFCGTEYILKQNIRHDGGMQDVDYMGRGPLFSCFIPYGWTSRIIKDESSESYQATLCRGLRLDSPDGARLLFYPFAYFRNFGTGKLTLHKDYQADPATGTRFRRCVALEQYISERLVELFGQVEQLHFSPAMSPDGILERRTSFFAEDAAKALRRPVRTEQGKFAFSFVTGGAQYGGYIASALARIDKPQPQPEPQSQSQTGGKGFLGKMMSYKGILGGPSVNDISDSLANGGGKELLSALAMGNGGLAVLSGAVSGADWGRGYDFVLIAPATDLTKYEEIFDRFCACLEYGNLYYALQDEESQKIQEILLQGMRDRQQIAFNGAQRVRATMSETSDIINRGYQRRSDTMNDISRKQAEAVRGVNTYTDRYGRNVEADVKYERVFQKGGTCAGSTDASFDPGADWEELHRR